MSNPRVSYVIPCYNYGRYVGQTVDSILNQTFQSVEVIVIDDASTDETPSVLECYRDNPRVSVIRHDQNSGPIYAYNNGLKMARGELLGVFGADDYMLTETAIEQLVNVFDTHQEVGFVYSAHTLVHASGTPFREARPFPEDYVRDGIDEFSDLIHLNYIPHSGTLVRRSSHDVVGYYDRGLRHTADWDMWLRLSASFPVGYVSNSLHAYRIHDTNMSHRSISPSEANRQHLITIKKAFDALPADLARTLPVTRIQAIQEALLLATWNDRSLGRIKRSWAGLTNALTRQPSLALSGHFQRALARLMVLTVVGPDRYEGLARWRLQGSEPRDQTSSAMVA